MCAKRNGEPKELVKDWYYLTPRGSHSLVITSHPFSIKHWRSQWFWAAGDWQTYPSDPVPEITVPEHCPIDDRVLCPKIGLAGLAAKKVLPLMKGKNADMTKRRSFLDLVSKAEKKGLEAEKEKRSASSTPREVEAKASSRSQPGGEGDDDLEVIDEDALKKAKRP
ncbi:hypothetical protein Fot_07195 [Forsythia ovata]|uniref:Uncharacterized protein n=1 Tax=Forsythia ovata TaxID=205694 RepID=A0ABD1WV47_9LAMI